MMQGDIRSKAPPSAYESFRGLLFFELESYLRDSLPLFYIARGGIQCPPLKLLPYMRFWFISFKHPQVVSWYSSFDISQWYSRAIINSGGPFVRYVGSLQPINRAESGGLTISGV